MGLNPDIASRLKNLMECQNIKVNTLARKSGVSGTAITSILNGITDNPRIDTCISLAKFFKVSLEDFLFSEKKASFSEKIIVSEENQNKAIPIPIIKWKTINEYLATPQEFINNNTRFIFANKSFGKNLLAVSGDKETDNFFPNESIIIFDLKKQNISHGDIVLVSFNKKKPTIKSIFKDAGELYLTTPNTGIEAVKIEDSFIIGKAVFYQKTLI